MKLNASHIGSIHILDVQCSYFLLNTHVISERRVHKMILYMHSNEQRTGSVILGKLKFFFFLFLPLESSLNVYSWQGFHYFLSFLALTAYSYCLQLPKLSEFIPRTIHVKYKNVIYYLCFIWCGMKTKATSCMPSTRKESTAEEERLNSSGPNQSYAFRLSPSLCECHFIISIIAGKWHSVCLCFWDPGSLLSFIHS